MLQKEKEELQGKLDAELEKQDAMEEKIVDFLEQKAQFVDTIKEVRRHSFVDTRSIVSHVLKPTADLKCPCT